MNDVAAVALRLQMFTFFWQAFSSIKKILMQSLHDLMHLIHQLYSRQSILNRLFFVFQTGGMKTQTYKLEGKIQISNKYYFCGQTKLQFVHKDMHAFRILTLSIAPFSFPFRFCWESFLSCLTEKYLSTPLSVKNGTWSHKILDSGDLFR